MSHGILGSGSANVISGNNSQRSDSSNNYPPNFVFEKGDREKGKVKRISIIIVMIVFVS
jgi:hypothetical protein